jgi:hypothetical protein
MTRPEIEELARRHPKANDPYEPYSGVTLLFNGDWRLGCRADSDRIRSDWDVISEYEISYTGPTTKEILAEDDAT